MKTILKFKLLILILFSALIFSCSSSRTGSAADTTGTNGATNGTGKMPKTN